jgi:hypothetical protein
MPGDPKDPLSAEIDAALDGVDLQNIDARRAAAASASAAATTKGGAKPAASNLRRGTIAGISGDDVFVELGPRMQGVAARKEFDATPAVGQAFDFTLHGREDDLWVLRAPVAGVWQDLYVFTLEPQLPVDFEPPNHYVSTHPDSRFVQTLTVQHVAPDSRRVLRNTILTTTTPAGDTCRTLSDADELLTVLAEEFGLILPGDTQLLPNAFR